jgi:hypothetical protein
MMISVVWRVGRSISVSRRALAPALFSSVFRNPPK